MLFSGISLTMILASIPALIIAAAGHEFAHAKCTRLERESCCTVTADEHTNKKRLRKRLVFLIMYFCIDFQYKI